MTALLMLLQKARTHLQNEVSFLIFSFSLLCWCRVFSWSAQIGELDVHFLHGLSERTSLSKKKAHSFARLPLPHLIHSTLQRATPPWRRKGDDTRPRGASRRPRLALRLFAARDEVDAAGGRRGAGGDAEGGGRRRAKGWREKSL